MRPKVNIVVTAWNKDGYRRDIVIADEQQTRMTDGRVKDTIGGLAIDPADFPEMVRFTVKIEPIY